MSRMAQLISALSFHLWGELNPSSVIIDLSLTASIQSLRRQACTHTEASMRWQGGFHRKELGCGDEGALTKPSSGLDLDRTTVRAYRGTDWALHHVILTLIHFF